jgi:trigger factor
MSVVTAYEDAGPWRKKLTIEVPAPAVDAEVGRVVKSLGKDIRLPGFRPGKAPASLVAKRFAEEIKQQVAERLIPRYWHQAEAEKSLEALGQPQVEDVHFVRGEPMTFVATVETRPEIEITGLDSFDLPNDSLDLQDGELDDAIRDLLRAHATWEPVEREAATGDLVTGKVFEVQASEEDSEGQPLRMEIGGEGADEELSLVLTGVAADSSRLFKRQVGEEDEKVEKEYRIEVAQVEEQKLPELDEDFLKRLDLADEETLREEMTQRLLAHKKADLRSRREAALLQQLRDGHPLDPPTGVVEREMQQMMHEYASDLASKGVDVEKAPINWESLAEQMRPQASSRVHTRLLLDAVAKAQEVKLDEEEFEHLLASSAAQQQKSSLALRQELSQSGRLPELRTDLLHQQTIRHLLGEDDDHAAADLPAGDQD